MGLIGCVVTAFALPLSRGGRRDAVLGVGVACARIILVEHDRLILVIPNEAVIVRNLVESASGGSHRLTC